MLTTPQPYLVHLRVGEHEWDIDSAADDPDFGPLAGVRFAWTARQDDGWPTQHDPTVLVFGIIVEAGIDFSDVDQGTPVHFTFTPTSSLSPLVEFGGTIRDLTATPHPRGMVYQITAVDYLVELVAGGHTVTAYRASGASWLGFWGDMVSPSPPAPGVSPSIGLDPFTGQSVPGNNGFVGADEVNLSDAPAWPALLGWLGWNTRGIPDLDPFFQRGILSYRLDANGDHDAVQQYQGTWLPQGYGNAPLELALTGYGWGAVGGNVNGCALRTDATLWERQRIEPNEWWSGEPGTARLVRPHDGPAVLRTFDPSQRLSTGEGTEPTWLLAGRDGSQQWGTEFALLAAYDPDSVAGWFTLPEAQRVGVAIHSIDPRHTPDGSGTMFGMLAGASLHIPPGGRWEVRFSLRKTLPDYADPNYGGWPTSAMTLGDVPSGLTLDQLDPALTLLYMTLIGA